MNGAINGLQTNAGSFYADFDKVWQKDLTSFIERDRNHPSIVIWSLGNEVAAASPVPAYIPDTLKYLVPFARKLDNTPSLHPRLRFGLERRPRSGQAGRRGRRRRRELPGLPLRRHSSAESECRDLRHRARPVHGPQQQHADVVCRAERPLCHRASSVDGRRLSGRVPQQPGRHERLPRQLHFPQVVVLLPAKPMERCAHGAYHDRQWRGNGRNQANSGGELEPDQTGRRRDLYQLRYRRSATSTRRRSAPRSRAISPRTGSCNGRTSRGRPGSSRLSA